MQVSHEEHPLNQKVVTFLLAAQLLVADYATADSITQGSKSGWSGTAGLGPWIFSKYTGGTGTTSRLLPLVSANYNEIVYIEPLRANIYLASSTDKKLGFGLAVEPRMGFHSSDGIKLAGMATRRNSLEGGLNIDWDADVVAISVSYLTDLTHSSGGTSSRLYFYKEAVKNEKWRLGANVGIDHMSKKVTNYFFGTTAAEVTANRPLYQAGSASNIVAGFDGNYKMNQWYSLVFGLQKTYLTGSAANSPIVETKQATVGWIGVAWNL